MLPPGGDGEIVAGCFLLHGYCAHTNRAQYLDFAKLLAARGVAVVLWDHQGQLHLQSSVMADTSDYWRALIDCCGRHRRPGALSNLLLRPTPQASGTL